MCHLKHTDYQKSFIVYVSQEIWLGWHRTYQQYRHTATRESAIYNKLKTGPVFTDTITHPIPRESLIKEIRQLITPTKEGRLYPLIIGEHGTGKTSLIEIAVGSIAEPKGIVYVDMPSPCNGEDQVVKKVQGALGWSPDPLIDSSECNCCSSFLILPKANRFAAASLGDVLDLFSRFAIRYEEEHKRVPVLIIDNANKLVEEHQELLDKFQDYAKKASDKRIATVVFVSSEGRLPRHMISKSIMFVVF
jgi:hypothetical protein